jgi:hypothetical protein
MPQVRRCPYTRVRAAARYAFLACELLLPASSGPTASLLSRQTSVRLTTKPVVDSFSMPTTPQGQKPKRFERALYPLADMANLQRTTSYTRKYDSCWEQEGETQSDEDEELEFACHRQTAKRLATQPHAADPVRPLYLSLSR